MALIWDADACDLRGPTAMSYEFPDAETLGKYHALLMMVLVEARALAWRKEPHERIAKLLSVVHNLPDLLCRWSETNEQVILNDLLAYEGKYHAGASRFTRILLEGPPEGWQLRWVKPESH